MSSAILLELSWWHRANWGETLALLIFCVLVTCTGEGKNKFPTKGHGYSIVFDETNAGQGLFLTMGIMVLVRN